MLLHLINLLAERVAHPPPFRGRNDVRELHGLHFISPVATFRGPYRGQGDEPVQFVFTLCGLYPA